MSKLEELKKICSEATPGPWRWYENYLGLQGRTDAEDDCVLIYHDYEGMSLYPHNQQEANALHIATFDPLMVGKLLAVASALKSDLDDYGQAGQATIDALRELEQS